MTSDNYIINQLDLPFILNQSNCLADAWFANGTLGNVTWSALKSNGSLAVAGFPLPNASTVYEGLAWHLPEANFDNLLYAMVTLLEVSSLEGWILVLYQAIDATSPYQQPVNNGHNDLGSLVFFMVYIIVANFFVLNLLVSVLLRNYYDILFRRGTILKTQGQKVWRVRDARRRRRAMPPSDAIPRL